MDVDVDIDMDEPKRDRSLLGDAGQTIPSTNSNSAINFGVSDNNSGHDDFRAGFRDAPSPSNGGNVHSGGRGESESESYRGGKGRGVIWGAGSQGKHGCLLVSRLPTGACTLWIHLPQSVASFFTQGARGHVWGIARAVLLLLFFVSLPVFDALQALLWGGGYIGEVSAVGAFRVDAAFFLARLLGSAHSTCRELCRLFLLGIARAAFVTSFFPCLVVAFPLFDLLRVVEGDEGVVFGGGHIRRQDVLHREAERGDCARLLSLRIFFALSPISNLRRGGVRSATWARGAVSFAARAFEVLGTACLLPFPFLCLVHHLPRRAAVEGRLCRCGLYMREACRCIQSYTVPGE
ncbi:hypothetical protein B0H14DRAFT_1658689 [Mycena olivaceomarginata]|nr:hypothetical protein B0H14DRAFT_1658689 [Mycena olivaceomarginata]